jgi:hypothetical protein
MGSERAAAQPVAGYDQLKGRQLAIAVGGVLIGLLLSALDGTIVGTAMPRVIADLGGLEHYAWVATVYLLGSTAAVPIFGKLSDLYGRKWFYVGGLLLFMLASTLGGGGWDRQRRAGCRTGHARLGSSFPPKPRATVR